MKNIQEILLRIERFELSIVFDEYRIDCEKIKKNPNYELISILTKDINKTKVAINQLNWVITKL
jgi:hypothetical protein